MSLRQLILESSLPNKNELAKLIRSGLQLKAKPIPVDLQVIGASRIGGIPDLPSDVDWPHSGDFPHSFVAQINCADLPDFEGRDLLPQKGRMYFFYETTQDFSSWFLPPGHSFFSVFHLDRPVGELSPRLPPDALTSRARFGASELEFIVTETFPYYGTDALGARSAYAELSSFDLCWELDDLITEHLYHGPQISGHLNAIEGGVEIGLEYARLSRDHPERGEVDIDRVAATGFVNWELLLYIPSNLKLGIQFGYDLGEIFFMIHRQDLIARRFEQTWFGFYDH